MGWWLWWAPTQPPAEQHTGGSGEFSKQWSLPLIRAVIEGNLADGMFLLWSSFPTQEITNSTNSNFQVLLFLICIDDPCWKKKSMWWIYQIPTRKWYHWYHAPELGPDTYALGVISSQGIHCPIRWPSPSGMVSWHVIILHQSVGLKKQEAHVWQTDARQTSFAVWDGYFPASTFVCSTHSSGQRTDA